MGMKEFFKNLRRYKVSSVLNILGLSIAFAAAYIIMVQVNHDLTYNRCFKDADRVYRLEFAAFMTGEQDKWIPYVSPVVAQIITNDNDDIESVGLMSGESLGIREIHMPSMGNEDEAIKVIACMGDAELPRTLGIALTSGGYEHLSEPNSVLFSESFALRHGLEINDVVRDEENVLWTIRGTFEDFPTNSMLGGCDMYRVISAADDETSLLWDYTCYYKLTDKKQKDRFLINSIMKLTEIPDFIPLLGDTWVRPDVADTQGWLNTANKILRFTPLCDTYFSTDLFGSRYAQGDSVTTYILLSIAVLILMIAFINFFNFFMAMVPRRIRRVNTEKVFGCPTWKLRLSFVYEAMGLVAISLLIATYIIFMIAPEMAGFLPTSAALGDNPKVIGIIVLAGLALAIVSSIYPVFYITSFSPAFALKGTFGNTASGRRLRYVLLTLQFFISIGLIICTIFIRLQYSYMVNSDIGFNKENILTVDMSSLGRTSKVGNTDHIVSVHWDDNQRRQLTSLLKENPQIQDVTYAGVSMVIDVLFDMNDEKMNGEPVHYYEYGVAHNFLQFMGISITEGKDFSIEDEKQPEHIYIFNETGRKQLGLTLDERFTYAPSKIVGFCKDFKFRSLQQSITPYAFRVSEGYLSQLFVRTTPATDIEEMKQYMYACVAKQSGMDTTDRLVDIESIEQQLERQYEHERKLNRLITIFSLISICISLMGVFGLVFFETQYRRREIAVRRVHGAKIGQILGMFVGQYAKMVLVAFLFAVPVSYLIMWRWLQGYAYHIPLYWWVFALALLIVLAVTSAIVLARSWRAAKENPVEALYKE